MINLHQLRHMSNPGSSFSTREWTVVLPSPEFSTTRGSLNRTTRLASALLYSRSRQHMFRISTIETSTERRLVVEGTLTKPCVAELRRTWSEVGDSLDGRKMVIDLSNATVIDREGEAAILELMQEGAKFRCCGVLNRHVLKQLAQKCQTPLDRVLEHTRTKHER